MRLKRSKPMLNFEGQIRETEKRFEERSATRKEGLEIIARGNMLDADTPERVDKRLERLQVDRKTAEALLESGYALTVPTRPGGPSIIEPVTLERVLGGSDFVGVSYLELALSASLAVGRVIVRNANGRVASFGTGFMVSPRLLLTNNHVLEREEQASSSQIEFNYELSISGDREPTMLVTFSPDTFFLTNQGLDYTLVAVQPREPGTYGWLRLIEEEGKVINGEYVNIIQHPNGEPKQLALRENQLVDVLENFLHYRTDTAPGSSGSPVFNDEWEVIALHHSGVPKRDQDGNLLTRDGRIWQHWMGEHKIDWIANEGVRISRIVKDIKNQTLTPEKRRLRAEIFSAEPPSISSSTVSTRPSPEGSSMPLRRADVGRPSVNNDGSVTWTFPVDVRVRVEQDSVNKAASPFYGAASALPEEDELREALEELERTRTRTYYNEVDDRKARNMYYANVDLNGNSEVLFGSLSQLVQATHKKRLRYSPSQYVYPWVDLHPDRKLRSIYSGIAFDPAEFIREDFRISQERVLEIRGIVTSESIPSAEQLEAAIDLLESRLPYNCEHVVPQSWFNKREPMRGDLHHLFACESRCNSFRGNIPYFDFADFGEAVRDDCGKLLTNRFEPVHGKGSVARATMYFLLKYPGEINSNQREFEEDRIDILLDWHEDEPVTPYELHRNMAIFEQQGNRNPLIDFPELARKIDFVSGLG
jgi:endonuclease G, mitochondrial